MKGLGIKLQVRHPYSRTMPRLIWNKFSRKRLRCYAELIRFRPDLVVICQGHNIGGFDFARICHKARIPYVVVVQCNSEIFWFGDQLDAALASYKQSRRVYCVSRANLDVLRMQLGDPLPNAEVVWNPFNVSSEAPPPWPDHATGWRLACVARMEPAAKGHDVLLKTLALPEWRTRAVELNLYGAGPDEVGLRRYAEMLGLENVNFRGHVSDVRSIWEQNHMLVMPSRFEGLPLALVEAMWCARPACVTDVGGNAELCADDITGFVAPSATVGSLSHTLERAWNRREEWESLGKAGRTRVEELVPWDPISVFCERLKASIDESAQSGDAIREYQALSEKTS